MPRSSRAALACIGLLLLLGTAAAWWLLRAPAAAPGPKAAHGIVLRFASVAQGRAVLGADDEWVRSTSAGQRTLLTAAPVPVDVDAFRAFQAAAVLPWTPGPQARWQAAVEAITPALERLALTWPPEVLLVRSTGRESAEQPHTRGAAVVLPQRFEQQGFSDAEVLAHELWHVLSRHRPALATRLYGLIGYEPVAPLQWPASWAARRIANQDAPLDRHAMRLTLEGRQTFVMPVVLIADDDGSPASGATLLDRMESRLLEVVPGQGGAPTLPLQRGGEPVWHTIDATPAFLQRLGGNTDYTSHPDETIADNFMFLVSGRTVPNPALLKRIEAVLREPR